MNDKRVEEALNKILEDEVSRLKNERSKSGGIIYSDLKFACRTALGYINYCKELESEINQLKKYIYNDMPFKCGKVSNSSDGIDTPICEEEVYTMVLKSGVKVIVDMELVMYIEDMKEQGCLEVFFDDVGFIQISEIAYIGNRKVI
jgi:hypothetical protein